MGEGSVVVQALRLKALSKLLINPRTQVFNLRKLPLNYINPEPLDPSVWELAQYYVA